MCKCTPEIKTPFCGKPGCEMPPQKDDVIAGLRAAAAGHDRRVAELLEANNQEVERRRVAETDLAKLRAELSAFKAAHDIGEPKEGYRELIWREAASFYEDESEALRTQRDEISRLQKELENEKKKAAQLDAAKTEAANWKSTLDMYANAWKRELGLWSRHKRHEIDALVVSTRDVVARANERKLGYPVAVEAWRIAETARVAAVAAHNARRQACIDAGVSVDVSLEGKVWRDAEQAVRDATQAMSIALGCQPAPAAATREPE